MKFVKPFVLVALLGVLSGCPVTQSQDTPVRHLRKKEGAHGTRYYLYVPSTYDAKRTYSLVVTLHGTRYWDSRLAQIMEWKALAEKQNFIVAAPSLSHYGTQGILPVARGARLKSLRADDQAILAVVDDIRKNYNINKDQILLTGFSSGGYPLWFTGLRHPDLFHTLIARACNTDTSIMAPDGIAEGMRRLPVAILIGKDDSVLIDHAWEAFRFFRQHGWNKHNSKMKKVDGGHLRRPETAYTLWQEYGGG